MWIILVANPHGSENHEHTLLHECDDLLASENAESILANDVGKCFELKEDSTGIPKKCLGRHVLKAVFDNIVEV